jgi:hypothetical protein
MKTKIVIAVATVCLFFGSAALAQNPPEEKENVLHTEAQCMADAQAWKSGDLGKATYTEIDRRFNEMVYCGGTYSQHLILFDETLSWLASNMLLRESKFINRHKLWDKFKEEDLAEVRKRQQ